MVSPKNELLLMPIPDGECEVAEKVARKVDSPPFVCCQENGGVADRMCVRSAEAKIAD